MTWFSEAKESLAVIVALFGVLSGIHAWYMRKFYREPQQLRTDLNALNVRVGGVETRLDKGEARFEVLDRKMDDHSRDLSEVKSLASNIDGKISTLIAMKQLHDG